MDPEQPVVTDADMANLNPEGGVVMSFRLQIPNPVVGSIIGKSGEIIKTIRDQSGARVIIADSQPGEDRDVTIKGNLTAVDQAVNLILTNICQVPPNPSFEMEQPDDSLSLKVLVANDQAGAIIGKGGEVIKQLREESGARISVGKKIDFVRTVSIVGNVNTVRAALAVLVRLVHAHPSSARDPFLTGYRAQPGYRQAGVGGGAAAAAAVNPAAAAGYGFAPAANPYGNGMPPQAGIMDPQTPVFPEATNTLTLSVPHRSVGAIIGKRGQIINEIRAISGCRVDVASMTPDSQFRTITLTGTPQSIEIAHILIQKYTLRAPNMYEQQAPVVPQ